MIAVLNSPEQSFRPMRPSDLPEVMEIEVQAYAYPWTRGIFRDCLRIGYSCWVGQWRASIQSYAVMALALDEAHVLNICVRRDAQGRGYGREMMYHLLGMAGGRGARSVLLEVRVSNREAIGLYRSLGFRSVGTRKAYYPADGGREDALVLVRSADGAATRSAVPDPR